MNNQVLLFRAPLWNRSATEDDIGQGMLLYIIRIVIDKAVFRFSMHQRKRGFPRSELHLDFSFIAMAQAKISRTCGKLNLKLHIDILIDLFLIDVDLAMHFV